MQSGDQVAALQVAAVTPRLDRPLTCSWYVSMVTQVIITARFWLQRDKKKKKNRPDVNAELLYLIKWLQVFILSLQSEQTGFTGNEPASLQLAGSGSSDPDTHQVTQGFTCMFMGHVTTSTELGLHECCLLQPEPRSGDL